MSAPTPPSRVPLAEFRDRIRSEMVPLSSQFSYFAAASPFGEEDLRDYLQDPIAALPTAICALLPRVSILLVPHIERVNGKDRREQDEIVCFEQPPESKAARSAGWHEQESAVLAFAVEEMEVAEYHYEMYRRLATLAGESAPPEACQDYFGILREELNLHMHGEVDDPSWQLKQALLRRSSKIKRDSKAFKEYARQSLADTLTLYLHGICCDIDVETGPRQLPSRYLKRRLRLLHSQFPPPEGYVVFPEELDPKG